MHGVNKLSTEEKVITVADEIETAQRKKEDAN